VDKLLAVSATLFSLAVAAKVLVGVAM